MTVDARSDAIVSALDLVLAGTLGAQRKETLVDFFAAGAAVRYFRQPKLRLAHHFDITPAFFISDPLLGSVGIVELTLPTAETKPREIETLVRRHIDAATYARHLLLRDRELDGAKALTVELVLLTADETPQEKVAFEEIGAALRKTLRETESLFHIGVSVLCYGGGTDPFGDRIRRAFPWLLTATREWFGAPRSKPNQASTQPATEEHAAPASAQPGPGETPPTRRRLRQLTLIDYRLPGERKLVLSDARVHLVHGPNGSGKSSIVEALELVSTGKVARLEASGQQHYDQVIRHRMPPGEPPPPTPAKIALEWVDDTGKVQHDGPHAVVEDGLEHPIAAAVDAASFRLDQPLMDRLIGKFPHERAREFLRAFFPETKDNVAEYLRMGEERTRFAASAQTALDRLGRAKAALARFKDWRSQTSDAPEREDYPDLLNEWLEKTVIWDLFQRQRTISATLEGARAVGWQPHDYTLKVWIDELDTKRDLAAIQGCEQEAARQVEALQKKLASVSPSSAAAATDQDASQRVTQDEAEALNAVTRWLFDEATFQEHGVFGDKLARAINAGGSTHYGSLTIGGEQWAESPIARTDQLMNAWTMITANQEPVPWPGQTPSPEYEQVAQAQRVMLEAGGKISEEFIGKLRLMIAPVNELMALFTPARWSYSDINLPSTVADGKVGVNLDLGAYERPARAELHLNTAELNLFTVAMFLLCAARVPKPLNLLLFDDPLQNMDDLTATALARGLGKIARLWASIGRRDELLLLFHGEDDLELFRREVASAVYHLPWLSPTAAPDPDPIEDKEKKPDKLLVVQKMNELVAFQPDSKPAAVASTGPTAGGSIPPATPPPA